MYEIELLIQDIKAKFQLLVEDGVDYIFYSLLGSWVCSQDVGGKEISDMDKYFCTWFGRWLAGWIKENIDKQYEPKTLWWYHDIKMIAGDEQDEAKFFYDLCDQFFEDYRGNEEIFYKTDHIHDDEIIPLKMKGNGSIHIDGLIGLMKNRDIVLIEDERIDYIYQFLCGYVNYRPFNIDTSDLDLFFEEWLSSWLNRWVQENIDENYSRESYLWYHDIEIIAGDEQNEAKIFYELCDQFFEDYRERKLDHIERLLRPMQRRPKMYVAEEGVDHIFYFFLGCCVCYQDFGDKDIPDMDKYFCTWFGRWLVGWIKKNVDQQYEPKTLWWYHDIRMIAGDEQDEAKVFLIYATCFIKITGETRTFFAKQIAITVMRLSRLKRKGTR